MSVGYPASIGAHPPLRSLGQALADLQARFDRLRMDDPRREPLSRQIVALLDEIDDRSARAIETAVGEGCDGDIQYL